MSYCIVLYFIGVGQLSKTVLNKRLSEIYYLLSEI
jgi:hypothetical protein